LETAGEAARQGRGPQGGKPLMNQEKSTPKFSIPGPKRHSRVQTRLTTETPADVKAACRQLSARRTHYCTLFWVPQVPRTAGSSTVTQSHSGFWGAIRALLICCSCPSTFKEISVAIGSRSILLRCWLVAVAVAHEIALNFNPG
jgi:hypothetical protein